ncbi:MAG: hypothetical protein AAB592_01065 [Patescibacteria group bacterium]
MRRNADIPSGVVPFFVLLVVIIVMVFSGGCGDHHVAEAAVITGHDDGGEALERNGDTDGSDATGSLADASRDHSGRMCHAAGYVPGGADGGPAPRGRQMPCSSVISGQVFDAERDAPQAFVLYVWPRVRSCVELVRESGYITLSHDEGEVTRDDDTFTWCVLQPSSEDAEIAVLLLVRSLTPRSTFRVQLVQE